MNAKQREQLSKKLKAHWANKKALAAKRSAVNVPMALEVPATEYPGIEHELYKAAHLLWNHGMITDRQLLDVTAKVFA